MKRISNLLLGAAVLLSLCMASCDIQLNLPFGNPPDEVNPLEAFLTPKKGVSVSRYGDGSQESADKIDSLNVSWYYNWSSRPSGDLIGAEFVPMVWGGINDETADRLKQGYAEGEYNYLLTFNEPDVYTPGVSSGISVERALEMWPKLEEIGIPLSSPAPTRYGTGWLDEFMTQANARGYRVDFIALHCYQDFSSPTAVEELKEELTTVYEKYGLPIWITEFGTIDITVWGGGPGKPECDLNAAVLYMTSVTEMLESLGFVERYAWFIDNVQEHGADRGAEAQFTTLFNDDDTISETGKIYSAIESGLPLRFEDDYPSVGRVGEAFSFEISAYGGTGKITLAAEGLPKGLTLKGDLISGTPDETGAFPVRITATDSFGQYTYRTIYITVL